MAGWLLRFVGGHGPVLKLGACRKTRDRGVFKGAQGHHSMHKWLPGILRLAGAGIRVLSGGVVQEDIQS